MPSVQQLPIPVPDAADFAKLNVSTTIPFYLDSSTINKSKVTAHSKKVLKDLILTLKEYPHIKIVVDANYATSDSNRNLNTLVPNKDFANGINTPIHIITNARAKAMIDILKKAGANPSQLIKGEGTVGNGSGPVVNFKVVN